MLADVIGASGGGAGGGVEHPVRMLRADGSVRELRALGRLERASGGPASWIGSVQDVTDQRLSERELRAHYAVSQALREWESFDLGVVDLLRRSRPRWTTRWRRCGSGTRPRRRSAAARSGPRQIRSGRLRAGQARRQLPRGEGKPGLPGRRASLSSPPTSPPIPTFARATRRSALGIASAVAFPAVGPDGPVAVLSFYSFEHRVPSAELVRTLTAIGRELGRFLSRRRPSSVPGRSPSASSRCSASPPRASAVPDRRATRSSAPPR